MSEIITRIGEFAFRERISIRQIENAIGSGNGTLSKAVGSDKDVHSKWIARFMENFPQVSTYWLLTGKGPMLKTSYGDTENQVAEAPTELIAPGSLRQKEEIITALTKVIQSMENQLIDKERLIEMKDRYISELEQKLRG